MVHTGGQIIAPGAADVSSGGTHRLFVRGIRWLQETSRRVLGKQLRHSWGTKQLIRRCPP